MNSSDPTPTLPAWPFIVTDVALIAAAAFIALSTDPLTVQATGWIVACVGAGAIVGLVPLVVRYERQKNALLDSRQRALEALAVTVSSSAEQLGIATAGLHEIAELAQKNVRHAEQLPHRLQEKIAEFQAQLATAADAEKEELERELLALRTTESERLETISQRIAKSTAEWAKLETATQQHFTAATDAFAKLSARGVAAIEAAKPAVLAELALKLAAAIEALEAKVARLEAAARLGGAATLVAPVALGTDDSPAPAPTATAGEPAPLHPTVAQPPKRPRKVRREESAGNESVADVITEVPFSPALAGAPSATAAPIDEPPPVPTAQIVEIAPVAPGTAEPFAGNIAADPAGGPPAAATPAAAESDPAKAPRKRAAKKLAADGDPSPALELDESASTSAASVAERVLTSDGATRLIVTAYIGIGNRLFIRGAGPGLSWERGVPLQFVSIGKWRWETNEASAPVQFKIYKNDELECAALGAQSLDPGHQQELTAAF